MNFVIAAAIVLGASFVGGAVVYGAMMIADAIELRRAHRETELAKTVW